MYKVLLADDEQVICEGLKALIDWENLGFNVCGAARNGAELLEYAKKFGPDLIITDIKMPVMGGLEALAELRRSGSLTEVLLLSGYAEFEYARNAIELGSCGYMMKPVDDDELVRHLRRISARLARGADAGRDAPLKIETGADMGVINDVIGYIKNKYDEKITLRTAAERFYLNTAYLGQLFKRKTGVSFNDYISQLRMNRAKQLLLTTQKCISEIASEIGYDDPNYFSAKFAKTEGTTPREYRLKGGVA